MSKQCNKTLTDLIVSSINDSREFISNFPKPHLAIEWITNEVVGLYYFDIHGNKTKAAEAMGVTDSTLTRKYLSRNMARMSAAGHYPKIHRAIKSSSKYPILNVFTI